MIKFCEYLHSCSASGEENLPHYAEEGLKELIVCAGLAHIDSVIIPVLQ